MLEAMLLLVLIMTCIFVYTALTYFGIISVVKMDRTDAPLLLFYSSLLEIGSLVGALLTFVPFMKDRKAIREQRYRMVDGVVTRLDFFTDRIEASTRSVPVIEDLNTGEYLKLELDQVVEVGDRYLICILPSTKHAVIVERIS